MKSLVKNCPTHGLTTWMIIQTFYAGLNFSSRNLLDSAARGTFMSIILGEATNLLDNMMINYSEWHTERDPQGKKVNSVEETSPLNDKIDSIMSMLVNGNGQVDPNNVPLASLVAQEENVDVNFIKSNNFNNNSYRNHFGSDNYRPYPSNGNGLNSRMPSEERISEIERSTKNFMQMQFEQNKLLTQSMGEQTAILKSITQQLENLNSEISSLQVRIASAETHISTLSEAQTSLINRMAAKPITLEDKTFATSNAIQVRIDDNMRLLAELHARWEREDEMARENNLTKVCTITTSSKTETPNASKPPPTNGKSESVGKVPLTYRKVQKPIKTL